MQAIGFYLTLKTRNAAWLALVFALLPFVGLPTTWISELIIALVTLRLGARAGLIIIAWAALPAIALSYLGETALFINMVVFRCFLLWGLAMILRRYRSWSYVIQASALVGLIGVLCCHFFWPDLQNWWLTRLTEFLKQPQMQWLVNQKSVNIQTFTQSFSQYATGLFAVVVLATNLMLLLLARAWYSSLYSPGTFRREFYNLRVGYLPGIIMLCGVGLVLMGLSWAKDIFAILLLPFVFAGLSLVHLLASTKKQKTIILVVFYVGLVLLFPYSFLAVALLGWVDSWYNMRARNIGALNNQQKA